MAIPSSVSEVIEAAILARVMPGAALGVLRRGQLELRAVFGRERYEPDAAKIRLDSLWDLASITKVMGTTTILARMVGSGEIGLDDRLDSILREAPAPGGGATLRDLLAHRAGLAAELNLGRTRRALAVSGRPTVVAARRRLIVRAASRTLGEIGSHCLYSDIGMQLLGLALERRAGRSLRALVRQHLQGGLGLMETCYGPVNLRRAIPTEIRPWGQQVRGQVHDETAAALGGCAGHAGLFSTLDDLLRFGRLWSGEETGLGLSDALRRDFLTRLPEPTDSTRALGWDTAGGQSGSPPMVGFAGHNGYSGGAIWLREGGDVIVLLSNRTWPRRPSAAEGHSRRIQGFRNRLYAALRDSVFAGSAVK